MVDFFPVYRLALPNTPCLTLTRNNLKWIKRYIITEFIQFKGYDKSNLLLLNYLVKPSFLFFKKNKLSYNYCFTVFKFFTYFF